MKSMHVILSLIISISLILSSSCQKSGGYKMKFTIEASPLNILRTYCFSPERPEFNQSLKMTDSLYKPRSTPYIELFVQTWEKQFPTIAIIPFFTNYEGNYYKQVIDFLNSKYDAKITETKNILKKRMEEYGIKEITFPNSNKKGIIEMELNSVDQPERIRRLITEQCDVEFFETYDYKDIIHLMFEANTILSKEPSFQFPKKEEIEESDSSLLDSIEYGMYEFENPEEEEYEEYPLTLLLIPNVREDATGEIIAEIGPVAGYCNIEDTAKVNKMLTYLLNQEYSIFPGDLYFMWTAMPDDERPGLLQLISIKKSHGMANLNGKSIANASVNENNGQHEISLELNIEGARIFRNMTRDNIGKAIAIAINGKVFSFPFVMSEISGGKCIISGNFTKEEAELMATMIKSGYIPLELKIKAEEIVKVK